MSPAVSVEAVGRKIVHLFTKSEAQRVALFAALVGLLAGFAAVSVWFALRGNQPPSAEPPGAATAGISGPLEAASDRGEGDRAPAGEAYGRLRHRALALFEQGDFAEAVAVLADLVLADPTDDEVAVLHAQALWLLGRSDEAAAAYRALISRRGADPAVLYQLALVQRGRGDVAGALVSLDAQAPLSSVSLPAVDGTVVSTARYVFTGSATDMSAGGSDIGAVDVSSDNQATWNAAAIISGYGASAVTWSYTWATPVEDYVPHTLWFRARDAAGNVEIPTSSRQVWVDRVQPVVRDFVVNADAPATASTSVTVSYVVTDGSPAATWQMRFSPHAGGSWTAWEDYAAGKALTLTGSDGTKTVVGEFRDAGGNVRRVSDTIVLDRAAPVTREPPDLEPPSIVVTAPAGGAVLSGTRFDITGRATDNVGVGQVEVSVDGGSTWSPATVAPGVGTGTVTWRYTWTLPAEDGSADHVIVARVSDRSGNSARSAGDSPVRVDTMAPTVVSFMVEGDREFTSSPMVTVDSVAADASLPMQMQFSNDGVSWSAWQTYAGSASWTLPGGDGAKVVYARYRDARGNTTSVSISDTITLDASAPRVTARSPLDGARGVAVNVAPRITVSDPLEAARVSPATVQLWEDVNGNGTLDPTIDRQVAGAVTYDDPTRTVTFVPAAALKKGTHYFSRVTRSVTNKAGLTLAAASVGSFVTTAAADVTPPTVLSVTPADSATGVPVTTMVTVVFSEPMDPATIVNGSMTLATTSGGVPVPGRVDIDPADWARAYFYPDAQLDRSTGYTFTVTTSVTDVSGNPLASPFTSTFTTAAAGVTPHGSYGVGTNMCRNCHKVHGAATAGTYGGRLLTQGAETAVCYTCHDGSGANTNIQSAFASFTSGHVLNDSTVTPGPGLANRCSSCHGPHYDAASKPKQYRTTINGAAVTGNNYTWCEACHNDSFDWVVPTYPYPSGGISATRPQRAANGYPTLGTFPGRTTYNNTTYNPHNPTTSTNVVWPGSGRPSGDCRNCHASHGNTAQYDALAATFRPTPDAATAQSDRQNGTYAQLCLTCHDGSPASSNILQFVSYQYNLTGDDYTGGHRIFTSGGTLPVGAPLPCYDCHNPHGSKGNNGTQPNRKLISDEQWSNIDTTTIAGVVGFCTKCHLPWEYVAGSGQPEANTVPAGQLTFIEGLDRRVAANKLSLPNVTAAHGKANMLTPTTSCYDCHGNSYAAPSASAGFNVHRPARGGSCTACHSTAQDAGDGAPTRRAVVGEFSAGGGHHVVGAAVTDKDCGVCHLEGNAADGSINSTYHKNNLVNLRNPDTGDGTGLTAFASFTRNTASATLETWVTDVQNNLCFKCHDADGAASTLARTPTGTALRPFSANSRNAPNI
ncbi:MAG: Ig-like domain-containing protein, partial [Actinobacteria bacterium]|nr:Ig-like domain-containing protein [Actinomycetota bacterium]